MYFDKILEQFYKKYDYERIKREYKDIKQKLKSYGMRKLYKLSPFKLEVRMKDYLPKSIIILTDGYAPFPMDSMAGGIPVLWLLNNERVNPPWGKVARITVDA